MRALWAWIRERLFGPPPMTLDDWRDVLPVLFKQEGPKQPPPAIVYPFNVHPPGSERERDDDQLREVLRFIRDNNRQVLLEPPRRMTMTEPQLTPTDPAGLAGAEMERIDRERERERLANEKQAHDEKFRTELEHLLNKYSRENASNTPDFILADFLADCLDAWDAAVQRRNRWYTPDEQQQPFKIEGGEDDGGEDARRTP